MTTYHTCRSCGHTHKPYGRRSTSMLVAIAALRQARFLITVVAWPIIQHRHPPTAPSPASITYYPDREAA